jgi:hypothetical protein
MFGGETISLILPKLIRSVVRDDIFFSFLSSFLSLALDYDDENENENEFIMVQRHKASLPRSTPTTPLSG